MNYGDSIEILKLITKSKKILVNCHRNPDPDSLGGALAMYLMLLKFGKDPYLICPTEIETNLRFLPNMEKIKVIDFANFDYGKYNLLICLDSSSWHIVSGSKELSSWDLPTIVIDHHKTNEKFGLVNLVDAKVTSVSELLYYVFEDWKVELDKDIATCLMAGIIGDTGAFRFPGSTEKTFKVAGKLMASGADKDAIIFDIYSTTPFNLLKFWGKVLEKMKIDRKNKFVYSAMPLKEFESLGSPTYGRESSANLFGEIVADTDFGMIMTEQEKNILSVSFRSRIGFDTSAIAKELGGGGHVYASGAKVEGLSFSKAVEKVLQTARKYARQ